jgi:hypothetical protein
MTDILADYREWAAAQPAPVSTHSDRCHLWHAECMVHRLARRLEEAALTDAEREAIGRMAHWCEVDSGYCREADDQAAADHYAARAATLRGLLERTVEK